MNDELEKLWEEKSEYEFGDEAAHYKEYVMSLLVKAYNLGKTHKNFIWKYTKN